MEIEEYNRVAWDRQVEKGNQWTLPVSSETVAAAREGNWNIVLTPQKPVPRAWFPELADCRVLCLASGGGQQAPILAAAGAEVTVFDNSPKQLAQDAAVAERENLQLKTVQGDMRDLSAFGADAFDLVFNPCSVSFVPNVRAVFDEVAKVLKPGATFMAGFINPMRFLFDETKMEAGSLEVRHRLPYADETHLEAAEIEKLKADHEPFIFSHTLEDMIAGQLHAGLQLVDFFEDRDDSECLSEYAPCFFGTLARKT